MTPGEAMATRFTIGDFDVSFIHHEYFLHLLTHLAHILNISYLASFFALSISLTGRRILLSLILNGIKIEDIYFLVNYITFAS